MEFLDKTIELMEPEEQKRIQKERLKKLVNVAYRYSKFHKKRLDKAGLKPENIKSLSDLDKIPLMNKYDLLENNPFDFICAPKDKIDRIFISGGTSGKPKIIFSSSEAVKQEVGKYTAIIMAMAGVNKETVLGALAPFGSASAGTSIITAAEHLGIFMIPLGLTLDPKFTLELIEKLNINSLIGPATTFTNLIEFAQEKNINLKEIADIKQIMTGVGAPLSKAMRLHFEKRFGSEVFNVGGATECDPLGGECKEHTGLHFFPTWCILEVLDSSTKKPAKEGEVGELVLTKIGDNGTGIIRYQPNDLAKLETTQCKCGRTLPRFWFLGRTSERVIVGKNIKYDPYHTLPLKRLTAF